MNEERIIKDRASIDLEGDIDGCRRKAEFTLQTETTQDDDRHWRVYDLLKDIVNFALDDDFDVILTYDGEEI